MDINVKKFSSKIFLWYIRTAAKIQLTKSKPVIVGIGGSAGKTSLCKLLYVILKKEFKVKASQGLNTETGVPLSILNIPPKDYSFFDWVRIMLLVPVKLLFQRRKHDFCIAEMATERPGDMDYLFKVIKPKIAALTNITLEHSENFDPFVKKRSKNYREEILKLIEKEESVLIKKIPKEGIVVLNIDDKRIAKLKEKTNAKKITVSTKNKKADFFVKNANINSKKTQLKIVYKNSVYNLRINRPLSQAYIHTILLAIALAKACGIKVQNAIKTAEKKFSLPGGRLSILEGIKKTTIIDSSYNAQPIAVLDALDFLEKIANGRRKVAILGDMRELGKVSKIEHERVAKKIKENTDFAILIGPLMKKYVAPILKKSQKDYRWFKNFTRAKTFTKKNIKENDLILVKSSQNTLLLERVVEMLLKNKNDKRKLCRQKPFWEKKRRQIP